MKFRKFLALLCLTAAALTGCGTHMLPVFLERNVDTVRSQMEKRCKQIFSVYQPLYDTAPKASSGSTWDDSLLPQSSIDEMERCLMDAGFDVIDTNGIYPAYLTTGAHFHSFWDAVRQNQEAEQEVISIASSGALVYRLFRFAKSSPVLYTLTFSPDSGETAYEKREIKDWALTEKENFFYRILPADDKHYPDYSLIRLAPPDLELYDKLEQYISPMGYIAANAFLIDWSEGDWKDLSFNDQFEYLYLARYGKQFTGEGYPRLENQYGYAIPSEIFEETVLPYYRMDLEKFRELAHYDSQGDYYPWRPLETNDFAFIWYYNIEPAVTACTANPDGTLTLHVEALSTDLKTDCLFAHEVTVRPLTNGGFQYVGNRVTFQTEYGLPCRVPRLLWE